MNNKEQKVLDTVNGLTDDILNFTSELVAEPSTLGNEGGAIDIMDHKLQELGFQTTRLQLDNKELKAHPGFAPVPWALQGKQNVVATLPPAQKGGKSAIFNGHLDVVDAGNHDYWSHDPYQPYRHDGWLYGRGSGDMKSGVAAMTYAAHAISKAGFSLRAPLTIQGVVEEECSGNGATACLAAGYDAEAVLIPEPFGPTILTSQVGVLWFKVCLKGSPTHVLQALSGVNAIEKCYLLISALRELETELNASIPEQYKDHTHPINLNIGIIEGGNWPSTVPAESAFHARLSYFPEMTYVEIGQRIDDTIRAAAKKDPWLKANPPLLEYYGFRSDGHNVDRNLPAFNVLDSCHKSLTGEKAGTYIATCTTDLRAFYHYGNNQPTCFGPVAENIHGIDERVDIDSIMHVARTYALFLARWCLLAE
ncbi:MAG: ArgE/DapE family deacylase [Desulfocapsaceae bacterium]|jgi:acetylornithine deacetylase|nr:ArgE/DapE family deacylase [Desulfocapsaceae bacterium]